MRRATLHGLFAAAAAGLLLVTSWQAYELYRYRNLIAAVAAVPATMDEAPDVASAAPEVVLATAGGLAAGDQFDTAETLLVGLIDRHRFLPLGQAARFNLANLYLREGMRDDLGGAQTRPLLEIAKQRYRDLLRDDPLDWDARYNLERALRLAPEDAENQATSGPPPKRVRVIVPDFKHQDLP